MEALPKIVRQRLQSRVKPGVHPHADLLTAFAEKMLTEREGTRVLEHLSRCEDCREVVFLAAPQQMPVQAGERVPVSVGWLSWPVLRWGAALACVVVVGTAITLHQQSQNRLAFRDSEKAVSEKTQSPAPNTAPPETERKTTPNSVPLGEVGDKIARSKDVDKLQARSEPTTRPSRNAMTAIPRLPMQFDRSRQINGNETGANGAISAGAALDENQPVASAPAMMAKGANLAAQAENSQKQAVTGRDTVNVSAASETAVVESANAALAKTKDASNATGREFAYSAKKLDSASNVSTTVAPRWMLTSGGVLQRSWDDGKTWEPVSVVNKVSFQTLASVAAEVWVGGASGILYHSSDAGLHWSQVMPQANGESLTAGIVRIEFSDAQNGKLTTVNGEIWTPSDAGKTWQKN